MIDDSITWVRIEAVQKDPQDPTCGCVIVRTENQVVQTPWVIGLWEEMAQKIANDIAARFPHVVQEHVGFLA